jgi:hypothetical protein
MLVIAVALIAAMGFSLVLAKSQFGRRGFLIFSVIDLVAVAGYEIYMHAVWEKSVHAPIRLDILVLDVPLLALGIVAGVVGTYRAKTTNTNPQA